MKTLRNFLDLARCALDLSGFIILATFEILILGKRPSFEEDDL